MTTRHPSVRTVLILLVLACLLPGVAGAVLLFMHEYRQGREQLERNTIQTVRAVTQIVDGHLLRVRAFAEALATSDALAAGDLARFHQRAREAVSRAKLGANVVLQDASGHQVVNTSVDFGKPLPQYPASETLRGVFSTAKPAVSDVFIGPVLNRPIVSIFVPVMRGGKVVYVLGVGVLAQDFDRLLRAQGLPDDWVAGAFDSKGAIVGRTRNSEQLVTRKVNDKLMQAMATTPEGSVESTTLDGMPVRSFYSRSRTTNWSVAIGLPSKALSQQLVQSLSLLFWGVAALFCIGLVMAWFIGGRIAHSVKALIGPASALGIGKPIRIPQVGIKEAAAVLSALDRAGTLLQKRATALVDAHRLAGFGTWFWNLNSGEIKTSDSVKHIYGRIIPRFEDQRGILLPPESWDRVNAAMQEAKRTGHGYDLELQVIHGQGHHIWVQTKCKAFRNENGEVYALSGTIQDTTERREIEEELRKFKFFSDHANDGHLVLDQDGGIHYANKMACEHLEYDESELLRMNIADIAPSHPNARLREILGLNKQDRTLPFEGILRRKDGITFPVEINLTVLALKGDWLVFATCRDISERKLSELRIQEAALHDVLTGLPNRAMVMEYCEHMLAAARRNHGQGALLFIDLDRFKPINDLYGHKAGDSVLQEVSKRLLACTRQEDLVGRLGGDEFVIVLPYIESGHYRAAAVAQNVLASVVRPFRVNDMETTLSASIGISHFPEHASDVGALIHTADMAMYQAKQTGRANYQFYTPELDQRAEQARKLEVRLKNALRQDGLKLYYQPVIDIKSGRLIGAEALVRLIDGGGAAIGPDRFIPIAESAGLIGQLGEWVAMEACRQHGVWASQGMPLTIAINVSPLQFRQRAYAEKLNDIIGDAGIDPGYLEIEVTESAVMENIEEAVAILNRIKSMGVKVALDDFGTGYSSLSSLITLPIDKLKVDQSFVRRVESDEASRSVTEAIIALGRSLRLNIHGEGIESENVLRYLEQQGCNHAQGYWFSRPLPAQEFAEWVHVTHRFRELSKIR